jgi:hypothetical protein
MAACNFHINGRHFTREKSNQFFMRKHSGLIEMKIVYLGVALYSGKNGVCVSDVELRPGTMTLDLWDSSLGGKFQSTMTNLRPLESTEAL